MWISDCYDISLARKIKEEATETLRTASIVIISQIQANVTKLVN